MKLHLILLASLFNLSGGFMVELKGWLNVEACTGIEFSDFKSCIMVGVAADPRLQVLTDLNGDAVFGGERRLQNYCSLCNGDEPLGSYCFTVCNNNRRLLKKGTDTSNLRRVQEADSVAVFKDGAYTPANGEAQQIAQAIVECLVDDYLCLGNPLNFTLTVTL
jgi:hypothetical protein